jgi:hypothetical protein
MSLATAATVAASLSSFGAPASARQALGEGLAANAPVAVVVKVPTPWYAPRFFVTRRMRDTIPRYQAIPGLSFKAFSFARADGHYGGIYLWKDEPGPAMRQWTRWCRHPDFAWGAEPDRVRPSLQSARFRIEAFSFPDDEAMTEACTRKLLDAMPQARSRLHVIRLGALGLPAIGHVGAFSRQASQALWPMLERAMLETRSAIHPAPS